MAEKRQTEEVQVGGVHNKELFYQREQDSSEQLKNSEQDFISWATMPIGKAADEGQLNLSEEQIRYLFEQQLSQAMVRNRREPRDP